MKRLALLVLVLFSVIVVSAQEAQLPPTPEDFARLINFRTSLEELNSAVSDGTLGSYQDRVVIIEGTVASSVVYSPDPNDFYAEVELISGRWEGLESVKVSRAFVVMMGPDFAGRIPERAPREPDPDQILQNMHITVAGTVYDVTMDDQGNPVPLIVAYDARQVN